MADITPETPIVLRHSSLLAALRRLKTLGVPLGSTARIRPQTFDLILPIETVDTSRQLEKPSP